MDDTANAYARLVERFRSADALGLEAVALEADELAARSSSTKMRVSTAALAAACRARAGGEVNLAAITDAAPPTTEAIAVERVKDLLGGSGTLADRISEHETLTVVPRSALESAAGDLLGILRRRVAEDLGIEDGEPELRVTDMAGGPRVALDAGTERLRIELDGARPWPVYRLVRTLSVLAYPGRYLVRRMRPREPEWFPSPACTVDAGVAEVGREVLLGDHELAREVERIGRRAGMRWNGDQVVAVGRVRGELASAYADLAMRSAGKDVAGAVQLLGTPRSRADVLVRAWRDPLARAATVGRAAGPALVRDWLVSVGQTDGLARLLAHVRVPTELRDEVSRGR